MNKGMKILLSLFVLLISFIVIACNDRKVKVSFQQVGKTEYFVGDEFDPSGFEIKIEETVNGKVEEKIVPVTKEMVSVKNFDTTGKISILVEYIYKEEKYTLNIDVIVKEKEKKAVNLEIEQKVDEIFEDEEINYELFQLKVTYDDGTSSVIKGNNANPQQNGNEIEFTFEGLKVKTQIIIKKVEAIKVSCLQYGKTEYEKGETFDYHGFVFEVEYNNGKKETINLEENMVQNIVIENPVSIPVSLKDGIETTIEVTLKKAVPVSLEVTQMGEEYYTIGKDLDLTNYVFSVIYSDGTKVIVPVTLNNVNKYVFEENVSEEPVIETILVNLYYEGVSLSCSFEVKVLAEWDYEEYIGRKEAEKTVNRILDDITAVIPDELTTNLSLPQTKDYGYNYIIIYSSSNPDVLNGLGTINQKEEDVVVTLTVNIKNDYYPATMSFDIIVKGLGPVKLRPWVKTEKHVFAYFYEGTSSLMSEEDAKKVDVINYCFAGIDVESGKVVVNNLNHLDDNLKLRRKTGVRIVLSIAGGSKDAAIAYISVCQTEETRKVFIQSMIDLIDEYHFDGIDLDWEYPAWDVIPGSTPQDKHRFTLLCKELREALDNHQEGLLLTAALIGGLNIERFYEGSELTKYLDYIHIMTYDLNISTTASHHANAYEGRTYSAEGAIKTYIDAGFEVHKLVIGVAFYGKISTLATKQSADATVLNKPVTDTKTITFTKIYDNYLNNPDYVRLYDEKCGAYYLTNGEYFITYEDPEAVALKGLLIRKYNIEGLMFWDYGSDQTGRILRAVRNEIDAINQGR